MEYLEGMLQKEKDNFREIAEILKLSESNVKVRLSRGRALLKDSLKEEWENDEW